MRSAPTAPGKVLDVLGAFAPDARELTLSAIARRSGLALSTVLLYRLGLSDRQVTMDSMSVGAPARDSSGAPGAAPPGASRVRASG